MNKSRRILLIVMLAALALAACGGPNYSLYGTWRSTTGDLTLTFQQGGHLVALTQGMIQNVLFTVSGSDTLTVKPYENADESKTVVYKYTIQGGTLTLATTTTGLDATQTGQAQTITLTRVK